MKKQMIALAAVVAVSNLVTGVAGATQSSQSGSQWSSAKAASTLQKLESASNTSVKISTQAGGSIHDAYEAVKGEATQEIRKGGVVGYGSGATLAIGAFAVRTVDVVVSGSTRITKAILEGSQKGAKLALTVTEEVTTPVAKRGDSSATTVIDKTESAASRIFNTGKGVVVGLSTSGTMLFLDAKEAARMGTNSEIVNSSKTLVASVSRSASAFGSSVVEGYNAK